MTAEQIAELERKGSVVLTAEGQEFAIELDDVKIGAQGGEGMVASLDGLLPVALDTRLNEELIAEGLAREVVNRIQNMRKEAGFDVVDRIEIVYDASEKLAHAIQKQKDYIMRETLAEKLSRGQNGAGDMIREWNIDGEKVQLSIKKIAN